MPAALPSLGAVGRTLTFYSLLESAKLAGVEPKLYLHTATRSALENPKDVILPYDLRP